MSTLAAWSGSACSPRTRHQRRFQETYARELCRALSGRRAEYRARPVDCAGRGDGLPTTVVDRYRASRSMPGRIAAMSVAAARPGPLRRALDVDELDALHFPLSVMLPPVRRPPTVTTVLDLQHEEHPEFFGRAELLYRRRVYGWTVRRSRLVVAISEHGRQTLIERYGRARAPCVRSTSRSTRALRSRGCERRRRIPALPARPWPKNHAAVCRVRARPARAARLRLSSPAEGDFGDVPAASRSADGSRPTSSSRSTAARPPSSSRRCTKALGCRSSRRWRAAARSRART